MTLSPENPKSSGTAVIVFEPPMLQELSGAVLDLGFAVEAFESVDDAMQYIHQADTRISVVIANATLPGVLNNADLATKISQAYPTLPIVLADHYDGMVETNVMCIDKPWAIKDVTEQVLVMVARLPAGKRPGPEVGS